MYSRILVPVDGSSLSEQVLPYVQQLGLGLSIPVTLMTVVEPSPPSIGLHLGPSSQEQDTVRHRADHAVAYVDSLADALRSDGVTVSTVTPSGSPGAGNHPRSSAGGGYPNRHVRPRAFRRGAVVARQRRRPGASHDRRAPFW